MLPLGLFKYCYSHPRPFPGGFLSKQEEVGPLRWPSICHRGWERSVNDLSAPPRSKCGPLCIAHECCCYQIGRSDCLQSQRSGHTPSGRVLVRRKNILGIESPCKRVWKPPPCCQYCTRLRQDGTHTALPSDRGRDGSWSAHRHCISWWVASFSPLLGFEVLNRNQIPSICSTDAHTSALPVALILARLQCTSSRWSVIYVQVLRKFIDSEAFPASKRHGLIRVIPPWTEFCVSRSCSFYDSYCTIQLYDYVGTMIPINSSSQRQHN